VVFFCQQLSQWLQIKGKGISEAFDSTQLDSSQKIFSKKHISINIKMHHQIDQLMARAIQSFQNGNLDEAEHILLQVLRSQSKNFDALHILGVVKGLKNLHQEALEFFRKALRINPNNSFLNFNIAKAFSEIGEEEKAVKYHVFSTKLNPTHPEGWLNFAKSLSNLNNLQDSLDCYDKALSLNPDYAEAWNNRGCVLTSLGQNEEALVSFGEALKINPQLPATLTNRGNALFDLKKYEEALASYDKSIHIKSDFAEAWSSRGNALLELKQHEEALASYDKAINIKPDYAEAWSNRGIALLELKQYENSLVSYDKAIGFKPDYAEAWSNRGNVFLELRHYRDALASFDKAISIKPDNAEAWSTRGNVLVAIGQFELAEASLRESVRINPNHLVAQSNLLFNLNYFDYSSALGAFKDAECYGKIVSHGSMPKFTAWKTSPFTEKLRVGFVSGDLKNHPVGFFMEGLIDHLDKNQFEIYAFPTTSTNDELTERLKKSFTDWVPIYGKSDIDAAKVIHQNGVHLLFDLSGHTAHNRLPVFSYKPAPVQVSWLGYFATTGLPEMDYFLGDPHLFPTSEDGVFTENRWSLPETWFCQTTPAFKLPVSDLPALNNGFVTFGSFGNLSKVNDRVIRTWALVLKAVPKSMLFIKSNQFKDIEQVKEFQIRFKKFDVSVDRLLLEGPDSLEDYLKSYNKVDFVLDTFPYPGGTTSVNALWMGIPVLTLKGDRFLSHLGESIAINAGLSDWIANDTSEYVDKAVGFASNLKHLNLLRSTLRDSVLSSPLFNSSRFSKHFGDALWGMWHHQIKANTVDI
jgi:predicted O-linked N-acetylglucosamine transferase (SPINDLY family)